MGPTTQGNAMEGGGPHEKGSKPTQEPSKQKVQKQETPIKTGVIGTMYPHVARGMAQGGGVGPPPPGKGGPPEDKSDDEADKEEEDETDTDEETASGTSSSQVSTGRAKQQERGNNRRTSKEGAGGPPEDPNDPSGEEGVGSVYRGPQGHRGQ